MTRRSSRAPWDRGRCGSRSHCSEAPAAGKTVTVYWSTAPGTAGSSDFAVKKGKIVFSGAQVFKTVQIAVKPDSSDESNELMYLVAAGVDGGENHRERGTGTIVDDDPGSGVNLVVSDATVVEGDSGTRVLMRADGTHELRDLGCADQLDDGRRIGDSPDRTTPRSREPRRLRPAADR